VGWTLWQWTEFVSNDELVELLTKDHDADDPDACNPCAELQFPDED
jgi:hypothetical protein